MTLGVSSFGNNDYDKRYYHIHYHDPDGDFTVEGQPLEHELSKVVCKIESIEEDMSEFEDEFCDIEDTDELYLLSELDLYERTVDMYMQTGMQTSFDVYEGSYMAGVVISALLFLVVFVMFLAGLGYVGLAIIQLIT